MHRIKVILTLTVLLTLLHLASATLLAQDNPAVFINEIHYENRDDDLNETIEVAGAAGIDLTGWSLVLYNGANRAQYDTVPLSGILPDQENGFGTLAFTFPTDGLQNGPDGVAVVSPDNIAVQFLSYEGSFQAMDGPASGMTSVDIGFRESNSTGSGESLQLSRAGNQASDFRWRGPVISTFGVINSAQAFGSDAHLEAIGLCGEAATPIHDIQGAGDLFDPAFGSLQNIEGVVVGNLPNLPGLYLQATAGDNNPATSEGIFVFASNHQQFALGNTVRVRGVVYEHETDGNTFQTQLLAHLVTDCETSVTIIEATAISLPVTSLSDFERYEGMFVRFPQELTISEYHDYDTFGEVVVALPQPGQDRPFVGTAVAEPGQAAQLIVEENLLSRITVDDGRTSSTTSPRHPAGGEFTRTNSFRGGDTLTDLTGVIDNTFGRYRLQPTATATYTQKNPRPTEHEEVGGSLKIAGLNVLNYFTTFGSRGAGNQAEYERQHAKTMAVLTALDADIAGLTELENNNSVAVQALVDGLNAILGADTYRFINAGKIGTDLITVGIIYKPATVTPVGAPAVLTDTAFTKPNANLDGNPIQRNRPALAQSFRENATGEVLTVVVNHLKSKSASDLDDEDDPSDGICDIPNSPDCDQGGGTGYWNETRTLAAAALVTWLAGDPTQSGDPDFLILGDLNSNDKETPITAIVAGSDQTSGTADDYTDLIAQFQGELAYSYVFDGQYSYLDHALVTQSLQPQVTGATEWHINADEPDIFDYNIDPRRPDLFDDNIYRAADHDPVVVGLSLGTPIGDEETPLVTRDALLEQVASIEQLIAQLQAELAQLKEMINALDE